MISNVRAQEFNYYSFNELYDFEPETIFDLHEDKSYNMWIATNEGVAKFNGVDFDFFSHPEFNNSFSNVKEDTNGTIWFSNFRGQLFQIRNEKLHVVINKCHGAGFIRDYQVIGTSVFYATTTGELIHFDIRSEKSEVIEFADKERVLTCQMTKEKLVAVTRFRDEKGISYLNVWTYDFSSRIQSKIASKELPFYSSKNGLIIEGKDIFFCRTHNDLEIFKIENKTFNTVFTKSDIKSTELNKIALNDGKFEILTKSGVYWVSKKGELSNSKRALTTLSLSGTLYDREQSCWVSTLNDGIKIIPNMEITHAKLLDIEITQSCRTSNGDIYFLDVKGGFYQLSQPFTEAKLLGYSDVTSGVEIEFNPFDKNIYFNSSEYFFNTVSGTFQELQMTGGANGTLSFRKLEFLNKDEAIICSFESTIILNTKEKKHASSVHAIKGTNKVRDGYLVLENENAYQVEVQKAGGFYIAYKDRLVFYSNNEPSKVTLNGNRIIATGIAKANGGGVWVCTTDAKILKIVDGVVKEKFNLPEVTKRVVEWNDCLFISSSKKVYKLNVETKKLNVLDISDGLLKEKIVETYLNQDTLFVLGENYLQQIPCSFQEVKELPPVVRIEALSLFEKEINREDNLFNYHENNITIHFSATALRSHGNEIFQYRLNDGDWIETTADAPFARFPKLAPGVYTFEIRAINEQGASSQIKRVNFTIDNHFTQKWWFVGLITFLIIAVVVWIVRNRIRRLQKQNSLIAEQQYLRKEVYKSKITALRAQMNPHFMFNALNTIQEFIITNQKEIASEYLADFADLMRKYLEQSKKEEILLSEELETLEIYLGLENLRSDGNLQFSIQSEPTLNPYEIRIPVMLLQPFIENAIKHGLLHKDGDKILTVSFRMLSESRLECRIEDNGIGRDASLAINRKKQLNHRSFSTSAIDQKIELVNESSSRNLSIQVEDLMNDGHPSGTRVVIEIDI